MQQSLAIRYSVRDILIDNNNWLLHKLSHKGELRPEQIKEVEAMLLCNDPVKGFFYYYCPDCDKHIQAHFKCNSRMCSRCGKAYADRWAKKAVKRMLDVNHSHIVFTMPSDLWLLIKDDWQCIKELSAATYRVMAETMEQSSKHAINPGMLSSLHTYGKDIKYNVHFHTIVTEGGMDKNKLWRTVSYFPYFLLRIKWKLYALEVITKYAERTIDNQILLESICYHRYRNGFNVRVIKTGMPKKELVRYIARYIRHPAISDRRIVSYDGKHVTIVCEDDARKWHVTFTVEEFITRLIQHIPAKNFKMIRYYGLYSRTKSKKAFVKQETITKYFRSRHSINCPSCGKILEPSEYFPPSFPTGPPKVELFRERITDWIS